MATLPNGLDTIELGRTAWRDILNRDIEKIDAKLGNKQASEVTVVTTNFNKNLTSAENTVQKALDKIDDLNMGGVIGETSIFKTYLGMYVGPIGGNYNVAVGTNILQNGNTGDGNTAIGTDILTSLTTGVYNTAIGRDTATGMRNGRDNVIAGYQCMKNSFTGSFNVAIGNKSLFSLANRNYNTSVGYKSLYNLGTGIYNTAIGAESGREYQESQYNVSAGYRAGGSNTGIMKNNCVNIGKEAGYLTAGYLTHQTNIGYQAGKENSFNNITNLGANTACTADNQVQLGDSTTTTYCYGRVQNRSDARDKLNITKIDNNLAFDFIKMLKPCVYNFNYRENYFDEVEKINIVERTEIIEKIEVVNKEVLNEETNEIEIISEEVLIQEEILVKEEVKTTEKVKIENDGTRRGKRFHRGLIAQEVKETRDILGFDFAGYQDHSKNGGGDVKSLGYQEFIPFLISCNQKLIEEVEILKEKIKILESK